MDISRSSWIFCLIWYNKYYEPHKSLSEISGGQGRLATGRLSLSLPKLSSRHLSLLSPSLLFPPWRFSAGGSWQSRSSWTTRTLKRTKQTQRNLCGILILIGWSGMTQCTKLSACTITQSATQQIRDFPSQPSGRLTQPDGRSTEWASVWIIRPPRSGESCETQQ